MFFYRKLVVYLYLLLYCFFIFSNLAQALPKQTQIQNAKIIFDKNGIPDMVIDGIGAKKNPATIALYALAYDGDEDYYGLALDKDSEKFYNSLNWLVKNLVEIKKDTWVWKYNFPHVYNDISLKSPWYSAFGQAVGIEALIAGYKKFHKKEYLETAKKAANILFVSIDQGGLLYKKGDDIWFEEVANSDKNPSHILNGHMRALIAIKKLAIITRDKKYEEYFHAGVNTLLKWLPLYDTGYWLRYDLNPKKAELGFRFNNPYGELVNLAIHNIALFDPLTGKKEVLQLGKQGDAEGNNRIAGNGWSQPTVIDEKAVRRLEKVFPASYNEQLDGDAHHAPYTYFYLDLPNNWHDNLRSDWLELIVTYKDEVQGNIAVQMRSISPGPAFQWIRNGDLLLTGSGKWREWRIPVRPSDLGFYCGGLYGEKHLQYLEILSKWDPRLKDWTDLMKGYRNTLDNVHSVTNVNLKKQVLPKQTSLINLLSLDENGVVRQHGVAPNTVLKDGIWDMKSDFGDPVYQLFLITEQARSGGKWWFEPGHHILSQNPYIKAKKLKFITSQNSHLLERGPAYKFILDNATPKKGGALLWESDFYNAYNDVEIEKGWSSSFTQAYVIKALKSAVDDKIQNPKANYADILKKALRGYNVPSEENGFVVRSHHGFPFFQEFSKSPHNLINAHLVSLTSVKESINYERNLERLYNQGIKALKEHIHLYENGYWLRYDLNPKKELLVQIDWLEGEKSPLIESITLENPQTQKQTTIKVNEDEAFNSYPKIAGLDWSTIEEDGERKGRSFVNGYKLRDVKLEKGAHHNVYFTLALPDRKFPNDFIIPPFKLKISYKDMAPGKFQLKTKPINMNDHHSFVPFAEGQIICNGDQKWKEAEILIYPKELGWFVGYDYQKFHAEQLNLIGEQTNDWFFKQLGEKHKYYLDLNAENKLAISKFGTDFDQNIYMSENDENNPVNLFRLPITYGVKNLADEIVKENNAKTPFEKLIALGSFSNDFKVAIPKKNGKEYFEEVISQRIGACGDFANLLSAFLATQGIKSRVIVLHNYPKNNGHVVLEVLINDKWMIFDPTYSSYFYVFEGNGNKHILNFDDLRSGKYKKENIKLIILNQKRHLAGGDFAKDYTSLDIYKLSNPAGVIGPEYSMYFPLELNLKAKNTIDTSETGNSVKNQGSYVIGNSAKNYNFNFKISGLTKGKNYNLQIKFKSCGGDLKDAKSFSAEAYRAKINTTPISKMEYNIQKYSYDWNIQFTASKEIEEIFIKHLEGKKRIYMNVDKIIITENK